jgi:periplasmic copper chaperone A
MISFVARAAAAGAMLAAMAAPAFAHITLEVPQAAVGGGYKAVLRVPHGCKGSATTAIKLKVPEGFLSAKPQPKAGWTLDIKTGDYAKAYTLYGSPVTSGAVEIDWSGGNLPDSEYDEFVVNGTLAGDLKAGAKLFFPVVQICASGEDDWIAIPVDGQPEPETPAPGLTLLPAAGGAD